MNRITLALLLATLAVPAMAGQVTIHTVTTHIGISGLEQYTPGIGYQESGYRFGMLRNSFRLTSLYGAKIFDIDKTMRIGVGFVTGYGWAGHTLVGRKNDIIPMLALEKDITKNLSVLWFGQALNLEVRF